MAKTVEDLIQEAKDESLWIRSHYQDLWFSPSELEQQRNQGHYLWGVESFEKVNPFARIRNKLNLISEEVDAIHNLIERLE